MTVGGSGALWQLAEDNLKAARLCHLKGFYRVAVSRYYYAVKYAAQAVLLHTKQIQIKSHRQLRIVFGLELVKTGAICAKWGKELSQLYELRKDADYSLLASIDQATADDVFTRATDFLNRMRPLVSTVPAS